MRFKIDEQLPADVATLLREAGHDAATVDEQELSGAPDLEIAEICRKEDRAILTLDLGFGDIRTYSPSDFPGIIVLRPTRQDKASVLNVVGRLMPTLEVSSVDGHLWIVDDLRIRIRG